MPLFDCLILSPRFKDLLLLLCSLTTLYLFLYRPVPAAPSVLFIQKPLLSTTSDTTLRHLFFSIASSSSSFPRRKSYIRLWYSPNTTRALVYLDRATDSSPNDTSLPPIVVSAKTAAFPYTFPNGQRSAVRIARILKESVERIDSDVRWFVFGDDDTLFFPENLVSVLSKYDHETWYYIGSTSESVEQNLKFSFEMAYGGGGFAISCSLARVLARAFDSCLMRYPHLYGSDSRVQACVAELGVGLTREPGFHQVDVRGDIFGMLTAHPLSPLLSLHHLDVVQPIFPKMNRSEALQHLVRAARVDPARILQQTVCYDRSNNLTVSVSWGYAVQVFAGNRLLMDLLSWQRTFRPWKRGEGNNKKNYVVDTRDYPRDPCDRPYIFFFESIVSDMGRVWSNYTKHDAYNCSLANPLWNLEHVRISSRKLELDIGQVRAPRRQCCDILHPLNEELLDIDIRHCGLDELISMDP
ncbi:hypothetical protein Ancab_008001 [Ancistrocladus abbreviatus]